MLTLKQYQQNTLDSLRDYFIECARLDEADTAFYRMTKRNFGLGLSYNPVPGLEGLPYVCLRIPTGGGKTLVACHSVGVASKYLLRADRALVLWLTPSNAIREQTLNALKDRKHPYRQALENTVGSVTVLDLAEAFSLQRATLDSDTTIIVSNIQTFRVEDTEMRKVYEDSGSLMSHFTDVAEELRGKLDCFENGAIKRTLANAICLRRPVVVVDEAHNARTGLSFETLNRFNPSCIIEFTATPDREKNPSNVLASVSAAELNAADMIKLPIRLETRPQWKELLSDAVALRNQLEAAAVKERLSTGEYLRPVMLLQAQPRRQGHDMLTVEVVERCLIEDFKIPAEQIRRATGEDRGLDGVDILAEDCEVRFIITVQALREGWDCPFAYILCSVAEMSSSTAVEQILGRVMRLPGAKRKANDELNMAYAFAASKNFIDAVNALTDALVQSGFQRQEAKELITELPAARRLFDEPEEFMGTVTIKVRETPAIARLSPSVAAKVSYDDARKELSYIGAMSEDDYEEIKRCFETPEGVADVVRMYNKARGASGEEDKAPAERGERFSVPVLAIRQGDLFEVFEDTHFLDREWSLKDADARLSEEEFSSERGHGRQGEITISDEGRIESRFVSELHRQMSLIDIDDGWTVAELTHWLDRKIPHPDISAVESGIFLTRLAQWLIDERGMSIDRLALDKYRLREAAELKIDGHRRRAHQSSYQALLIEGCETPIVVTPEVCFSFDPLRYPYNTLYDGSYKFKKHYYRQVGNLKSRGEEFECAQFLDLMPEIKFWARNVERQPAHSFWLQTSTDKFYPDFVCLLTDGRYLVVEYKGEDRWSDDDSKEKRRLGGLRELRSGRRCLFIMPKGKDFNSIKAKISASK